MSETQGAHGKGKYAPGPWKVCPENPYGISIINSDYERIAWCGTALPPLQPPAYDRGDTANAGLIAAAPELVEELEVCAGNFDAAAEHFRGINLSTFATHYETRASAVRELIAKAKGEEAQP